MRFQRGEGIRGGIFFLPPSLLEETEETDTPVDLSLSLHESGQPHLIPEESDSTQL